MFVARVASYCRFCVRFHKCASYQTVLSRSMTGKLSLPEHASSATRVHRQLSSITTDTARTHPLDTDNASANYSQTRIAGSAVLGDLKSKLASYDGYTFTCDEWRSFEALICEENPALKNSWVANCMGLLLHFRCLELAASLMHYLETKGQKPSLTTLSLYIALQGQCGKEDKEQVIDECYKKVTEITDVFDSTTAKNLIIGLSATRRWRETLDILEMAKMTGNVGPGYRGPVIQAAFREGDPDLGFSLLDELASDGHQPHDRVMIEIMAVCRASGSEVLLERYLKDYVWRYNWTLSTTLATAVHQHFTQSPNEKWTCKWTSIDTVRGVCHACKQDLPHIEVSSSDFEALQREFLEKALVGDNIYLKSNPQEVETFCDFVQENAPFDVVLDALNIAFTNRHANKSRQLREVVHYFARKRHMRVLVLGRAHMLKWSASDMKYIQRHAKTFFTDNISSDDPFCLYAALYSGKDCLLVSRDFMRNHKFSVGLRFKDIFERWQRSCQIFQCQVDGNQVFIKMPSKYDCGPVRDNKGWHIPYDDGNLSLTSSIQPALCLRFRGQRTPRS